MAEAFLRIPPYPGHRAPPLANAGSTHLTNKQAMGIARLLRENRVGGNYWGSQPTLPNGRDLLLAPLTRAQALEMLNVASVEGLRDRCVIVDSFGFGSFGNDDIPIFAGSIDWWHIAEAAGQVWADENHELGLVARLSCRPVRAFGEGEVFEIGDDQYLARLIEHIVGGWTYACPFDGQALGPVEAIELLSDWRRLIDRNRRISAVFGVAGWKRPTVDTMLWNGTSHPSHSSELPTALNEESVFAAWKSRTSGSLLDRIAETGLPLAEIEDGMVRGRGLGANCVPPFSIVVDFAGIYFDPAQSSDLEQLLETFDMNEALLGRAARLRKLIVDSGVSKYDAGPLKAPKSFGGRRVLVLGQVEDDRSVLNGGPGQTNLGLLERARQLEPEARLIYRPHPDVDAGHRKGHIPDNRVLEIADEIERGGSFSALVETVDSLHCITSLGGFEALLRGKEVTTHGVPFYAGWGLTNDLGPIPTRRSRRRNLDELVAASLILYPTYFDPVTRLPCPAEILVNRIASGEDSFAAPLAWLRSSQGKFKVMLRRLREVAA